MPTDKLLLDDADRSMLEALASGLPAVVTALRETCSRFHEQPLPSSPAALALADADLRLPYDLVTLLLMATDDHLDALATLLMARVDERGELSRVIHRYAQYPLLRAAAESAARAAWLLEPGIDARARLQRVLVDWLYSAQQQLKLGADHPTAAARIATLRAQAQRHGFAESPAKRKDGRTPGLQQVAHFGQPRVTSTDLFKKLIPHGDFAFRFLSAPTHATLYSLVGNAKGRESEEPGIGIIAVTVNITQLHLLTRSTLRLVDVAMESWGAWLATITRHGYASANMPCLARLPDLI
jgi:hypothetical protein